jgi:hypothetical protein
MNEELWLKKTKKQFNTLVVKRSKTKDIVFFVVDDLEDKKPIKTFIITKKDID